MMREPAIAQITVEDVVLIEISGDENMDGGVDWLHLYFRDTRYTVSLR